MNYAALVKAIQSATSRLQGRVATVANQALVLRNWLIGAYILEYEQNGSARAKYGERLLPSLAEDLSAKGIKGCSREMLGRMRHFYGALSGAWREHSVTTGDRIGRR